MSASRSSRAELQLIVVEALRPAPEAAALQRLHDLPQPGDLGLGLYPLAVEGRRQFADHAMQRRDVVRQGSKVDMHESILDPSARSTEDCTDDESIGRSLTPPRRASTDARASASRSP